MASGPKRGMCLCCPCWRRALARSRSSVYAACDSDCVELDASSLSLGRRGLGTAVPSRLTHASAVYKESLTWCLVAGRATARGRGPPRRRRLGLRCHAHAPRARASRGTARLRSAAVDVSPESHKTGMFCLSFELRVKLCNCSHFLNRSENHAENAFLLGQT